MNEFEANNQELLRLMAEWPHTAEGQRLSSGQTIGVPCAPLFGCLNSESFPPSVRAFHRVASSFLAIAGKVS